MAGLLVLLGALGGCKREPLVHSLARAEAAGASHPESALLGMQDAELEALLMQVLAAHGRFRLPEAKASGVPAEAVRLRTQVAFARLVEPPAAPPRAVEVGVTLSLQFEAEEGLRNEELDALVEEPLRGEAADAGRRALLEALRQLAARADRLLRAFEAEDDALVQALAAGEREGALRALVARRHPAALPALEEELQTGHPLRVRRAIGGLVELADARAVPALIALAKGQDPSFHRELLFAVAAIGGEDAQGYLFTVAQGHDVDAIRAVAQLAFEELSSRQRPARRRGAAAEDGTDR